MIWVRVGDEDDYHEFDTVEDVAEHLAYFYDIGHVERYIRYGVSAYGFEGHNYISLYWGPPDPGDGSADASRELTDEELAELNDSLDCYPVENCHEQGERHRTEQRRMSGMG